MKKQLDTKERLIKYIKSNSLFYRFADMSWHTEKQLKVIVEKLEDYKKKGIKR